MVLSFFVCGETYVPAVGKLFPSGPWVSWLLETPSRPFICQVDEIRTASQDTSNMCYEVHIIRGDATNSAAAQQSKVHYTHTLSMYNAGAVGLGDFEQESEDAPRSQYRSCVADLQFAPTGCTGEHLFQIYSKQLQSIGLPPLTHPSAHRDDGATEPTENCREPSKWLRIYSFVTDDGPDQRGCAKIVSLSFKHDPLALVCRLKCCLHQLHLIVAKQLKHLDGHYSDVAKIINSWRATGCPSKIFAASGKNPCYKTLPPRALKGRWGSVSAAEAYLLRCGFEDLPKIFSQALSGLGSDGQDLSQVVDITNVVEMDTALYKAVMGRWRRDAIAALNSIAFWIRLAIAHYTRKPIDHLMHWLMSRSDLAPTEAEGSASSPAMSASSGKLPPLLFGKLDCIMTEFEETLNADSPDWEMFHTLLSKESDQDESSWVASLVSTALEMAGEFHRRFVEYLSKFPTRLAWMTFQEPDFPCDVRKATAAYFLACADLDEEFSQKLRIHFMDDFQLCSQTGTISEPLHEMLSVSQLPFEALKVFEGVSILLRIVYIHKGCLNPRILSWKFRLLLVYVILIVCNLVFLLSFLFVTFTSPDSDCSPARLLLYKCY